MIKIHFRYFYITLIMLLVVSTLSSEAQDSTNACLFGQEFHIVVLGSSTAAGSGPLYSDSAWVNRYRNHLQKINPSNQVTNLAIGGTTTYHIMPSWFVPPAGRPLPNNNNITQAIALMADAIIVNMPSNDAANGFGTNEQMFNFNLLSAVADSAGIPIWICTTQPKTSLSSSGIQIQVEVKDSVLNRFGSFALDFWTTIATSQNTIDTLYDSGDGTHLNDAGHRILFQRVRSKNILSHLYDTLGVEDHGFTSIYIENESICGDSSTIVKGVIVNYGPSSNYDIPLVFEVKNLISTASQFHYDTILGGLNTCKSDTFSMTLNTYEGAELQINTQISTLNDTNVLNNFSDTIHLLTEGHPQIVVENDTVYYGNIAYLSAILNKGQLLWFHEANGGIPFHIGWSLQTNPLFTDTSFFVRSTYGPLVFQNSIFTTANSNINWNGCMFDLVASDTIIIDSLRTRIHSTGIQITESYYRLGSHLGHEHDSLLDWIYWGIDVNSVMNSGEFHSLDYPDIQMLPGDTLGVYLHMGNSNAQLQYQSMSSPKVRSTNELQLITGSGVSHTFGNSYYPRDWNGEVFYHHGFNPDGICSSERKEIRVIIEGVSIKENDHSSNIKVFPNPSSGLFHVHTYHHLSKRIRVLDVNAKILFEFESSEEKLSIDLQGRKGIFIVELQDTNGIQRRKLIVQ